ncbi:MAG: hypothetical protein CL840_11895 [Crocinitomicaceae bacterium]|nr:hypothetical protein [Crocinitomicaceae bacterium]|tara:strand:- start:1637 stop:2056 length:420 start_codon:yes stop_codon:yes gene_type:complete
MEYKNLEGFDPSTCISGKVMRINRAVGNIFRKYLKPFNITDSQLSILFVLTKKGGLTQRQMTDITILEKSSLNRNLKRLFDREFIQKDQFPIIEITSIGKSFVNDVIPEWKKAMNEISHLMQEDGSDALNLLHQKIVIR